MTDSLNTARGHHFVPQFLLRGFASRSRKKEYFSWLYRRGSKSFETNLKNIAKMRDFHGDPEGNRLESDFSHLENTQALLVRNLREGKDLARREDIANLFVSLHIRSHNLREVLSDAGATFIGKFADKLETPTALQNLAAGVIDTMWSKFREGEYDQFMQHLPLEERLPLFEQAIVSAKAGTMGELENMARIFREVASNYDWKDNTAKSHLRVLEANPIPPLRVQMLDGFTWKVIYAEAHAVLLGDVCGLADTDPSADLQSLLSVETDLLAVYLPLSAEALLVGSAQSDYVPRPIPEINRSTAELSTSFFISNQQDDEFVALHANIGRRAALFSETQWDEVMPSFSRESVASSLLPEKEPAS
jgi:hypothetical protein